MKKENKSVFIGAGITVLFFIIIMVAIFNSDDETSNQLNEVTTTQNSSSDASDAGVYCNGANYSACSAGEKMVCPADGTSDASCECKDGYVSSSDGKSCVTFSKSCQESYGSNSIYSGKKNSDDGLVCDCKKGYEWNADETSCVVAEVRPVLPIFQDVGRVSGYENGPLYYELITNSGPWDNYDNSSMKALLNPYVCAINNDVLAMNNGVPVSFSVKATTSGKTFFVTYRTGDCNNYLWGSN